MVEIDCKRFNVFLEIVHVDKYRVHFYINKTYFFIIRMKYLKNEDWIIIYITKLLYIFFRIYYKLFILVL
jgi:hypothetical protein